MKSFLVALILLVAATTAHADRKLAEQYFRAGAEAYHAQDFKSASESFDSTAKLSKIRVFQLCNHWLHKLGGVTIS